MISGSGQAKAGPVAHIIRGSLHIPSQQIKYFYTPQNTYMNTQVTNTHQF